MNLKLLAGSYDSSNFMLREELRRALSENGMSLGIKYSVSGKKLNMTLTPFENGKQSGDAARSPTSAARAPVRPW